MQRLLAESLEDGAVGLSSGLIYSPGFYSQSAELIALAEVLRGTGRPYCSHVRGETATVIDRATYADPEQPPLGMPHVIANGIFAVRDGEYTGARAGKVLRAR